MHDSKEHLRSCCARHINPDMYPKPEPSTLGTPGWCQFMIGSIPSRSFIFCYAFLRLQLHHTFPPHTHSHFLQSTHMLWISSIQRPLLPPLSPLPYLAAVPMIWAGSATSGRRLTPTADCGCSPGCCPPGGASGGAASSPRADPRHGLQHWRRQLASWKMRRQRA